METEDIVSSVSFLSLLRSWKLGKNAKRLSIKNNEKIFYEMKSRWIKEKLNS